MGYFGYGKGPFKWDDLDEKFPNGIRSIGNYNEEDGKHVYGSESAVGFLFTYTCNQCEKDGKVDICDEGTADVGSTCIGGCSKGSEDYNWCYTKGWASFGRKNWGL